MELPFCPKTETDLLPKLAIRHNSCLRRILVSGSSVIDENILFRW
jgi:hypothetical protein